MPIVMDQVPRILDILEELKMGSRQVEQKLLLKFQLAT